MTLKVIVALLVVLVGIVEANPVNKEVTDVEPEDLSDNIINGPESEETTEDDDEEEEVGTDYADYSLERRKRSPRRKGNRFGRETEDISDISDTPEIPDISDDYKGDEENNARSQGNRFGRSPRKKNISYSIGLN